MTARVPDAERLAAVRRETDVLRRELELISAARGDLAERGHVIEEALVRAVKRLDRLEELLTGGAP